MGSAREDFKRAVLWEMGISNIEPRLIPSGQARNNECRSEILRFAQNDK